MKDFSCSKKTPWVQLGVREHLKCSIAMIGFDVNATSFARGVFVSVITKSEISARSFFRNNPF
ncbi:hypothetical protein FVO95_22730 [Vibrio parahaemolyticus]|nr:hypothetical protein FVO95_22730 [Vibrio parahaemolyticus]